MEKILFLDDLDVRHNWAKQTYVGNIVHVRTAWEATEELRKDAFHLVSLDHDLGFGPSSSWDSTPTDPGDGMDVVKWIEEHHTEIPHLKSALYIIHSWNIDASIRMAKVLDRLGFKVIRNMAGEAP